MDGDCGSALPDVRAWSGVELIRSLTGGARNPVYLAHRRGQDFVVRVSGRPAESLEWELDLLDALDAAGVVVPRSVATDDGRRHNQGVLVQQFIPGHPPHDRQDWERVVATLTTVHDVTADWPQRPGFASASYLLHHPTGGDIQLEAMPDDAVSLVRSSWQPVVTGAETAIHGDLGESNVLITDQQVALIDWDEARVDVPAFDFTDIPDQVPLPLPIDRTALSIAGLARETATCWISEPDYAAHRLDELRARQ